MRSSTAHMVGALLLCAATLHTTTAFAQARVRTATTTTTTTSTVKVPLVRRGSSMTIRGARVYYKNGANEAKVKGDMIEQTRGLYFPSYKMLNDQKIGALSLQTSGPWIRKRRLITCDIQARNVVRPKVMANSVPRAPAYELSRSDGGTIHIVMEKGIRTAVLQFGGGQLKWNSSFRVNRCTIGIIEN